MLDLITPNWALLRNPANWLVVGFVLLIMIAATHYIFGVSVLKEGN
jgi:hypothetical protein